jgi:hypothetical protein
LMQKKILKKNCCEGHTNEIHVWGRWISWWLTYLFPSVFHHLLLQWPGKFLLCKTVHTEINWLNFTDLN